MLILHECSGPRSDSDLWSVNYYEFLFSHFRCPDTAAVGAKMIFASSKDALKKKLTGIQSAIDCSDSSDLDYKEVAAKAMKGH